MRWAPWHRAGVQPYTLGLLAGDRPDNCDRCNIGRCRLISFGFNVSEFVSPSSFTVEIVTWKLFRGLKKESHTEIKVSAVKLLNSSLWWTSAPPVWTQLSSVESKRWAEDTRLRCSLLYEVCSWGVKVAICALKGRTGHQLLWGRPSLVRRHPPSGHRSLLCDMKSRTLRMPLRRSFREVRARNGSWARPSKGRTATNHQHQEGPLGLACRDKRNSRWYGGSDCGSEGLKCFCCRLLPGVQGLS